MHGLLSALLDPAEVETLAADWEASFGSGSAGNSSAGGSSAGGGSSVGWEQEVMLHHPGRYPLGAICPAQLLLCPAGGSGSMQACLWVHPAAAAEAYAALKAAAQQTGSSASLAVLNVRRLELRGGAADTALAVALAGATASGIAPPNNGSHARARSSRHQQHRQQGAQQAAGQAAAQQAQQQQDALPPPPLPPPLLGLQHGEAVQLLLPDPRLCKPVALGSAAAGLLQAAAADEPQELDMRRLLQAPLPLSEAELSRRRQQLRQRMLHLEQPSGSSGQAGQGGAAAQQEQQQQRGQLELERRGYCPAVLVRHDGPEAEALPGEGHQLACFLNVPLPELAATWRAGGLAPCLQVAHRFPMHKVNCPVPALCAHALHPTGWSLIVPAGWVPPFWLAAAFAGCKPGGQREWRWLHTLQGRPCFPWDHADTAGHAVLMAQQQMQRQLALAKRPKAKQMLAAPASPPDWHDVLQLSRGGSKARPASAKPAGQQQGAAAPAEQGRAAAGEQGPEQPAAAMEVDATPGTSLEAEVAGAAGPSPAGQPQLFVARSFASMAAALRGSGSGSHVAEAVGLPTGRNPVAAGLQQGLLQWRPRQQPGDAAGPAIAGDTAAAGGSSSSLAGGGQPCCLVEAAVFPIKTGVAAEGAAVCFIAGREGERHRTPVDVLTARQQRRRQREAAEQQAALEEAGGSSAEAGTLAAAAGTAGSGRAEVGESEVRVIGYVSSEAPRGAPRRCGALAAVAAAPAWRLRALQHSSSQQDGGVIEAFIRNPGSATLFPVRLCLRLEAQPPL